MSNPVEISKRAWNQIIQASAASTAPISEDVLRELAAARGDDPDATVVAHADLLSAFEAQRRDDQGPMPVIV